jgi:LDH2 family malate/lactate/ureidoglycolate dehydrogenase
MIDMLCGPLNEMAFGPHVNNMYKDLDKNRFFGSLMMAIDPQRLAGGTVLSQVVTQVIEEVKAQGESHFLRSVRSDLSSSFWVFKSQIAITI